MFLVHINPGGHQLLVQPGDTVLDAALKQGYVFPYGCQEGICGSCRGQLQEGTVTYDDIDPMGLTDEEIADNYYLFCSAQPTSHCVIHVEDVIAPEQLPEKKVEYAVKSLTPFNDSIMNVTLVTSAEKHIAYCAGQYMLLNDGTEQCCPYSIANAPQGGHELEFHIRHNDNNPFAQGLLKHLAARETVMVTGPYGKNIHRAYPSLPTLYVAGGTGFAPMKALLEKALEEPCTQPLHLFWVVDHEDDFYALDILTHWQKMVPHFTFTPILYGEKKPESQWQGEWGTVQQCIARRYNDLSHHRVYGAGPANMITQLWQTLQSLGLPRHLFYSDMMSLI
ncbi:MAG: 2Fe-2S iron-sulfur cluster-binding protein [Gammaproteobacteria bacterium]